MKAYDICFTHFTEPVEEYTSPERFTFPFYYQPHPLCVLAAKQLQSHFLEISGSEPEGSPRN